jgi:hypothetical protein
MALGNAPRSWSTRSAYRLWPAIAVAVALLACPFSADAAVGAKKAPKLKPVDKRAAWGYLGRKQRLPIPAGPSPEGLERGETVRFNPKRRPTVPPGAKRIRLEPARKKAKASLFGYHGNFYEKRNSILNTAHRFYEIFVPSSGGTYYAPALAEVYEGASGAPCNGTIDNMSYCPAGNYVAWAFPFYGKLWDEIGDNAWAVALAHEYGHGSQWWLNYQMGGYFQYVVYREAFADCMAGAYSYWMYYQGNYDGVGSGDGQEFHDLFVRIGAAETTWDNHGTFDWRYSNAMYGWNQGWNGCIRMGNWIWAQ